MGEASLVHKDAEKDKQRKKEEKKRRVFVGNVPVETTRKEVTAMFKAYGKVKSVRIRSIARGDPKLTKKAAAILREIHPQRSSFNVYVVFDTIEGAKKAAKEANGQILRGYHIQVDALGFPRPTPKRAAVFLGGLPYDTEEEDLWRAFGKVGPVVSVRVVRDGEYGFGKGIGFVNFETYEAATAALELNGTEFGDRTIRVTRYRVSKPSKFKQERAKAKAEADEKDKEAEADADKKKKKKKKPRTGKPRDRVQKWKASRAGLGSKKNINYYLANSLNRNE